jgi:predicted permease
MQTLFRDLRQAVRQLGQSPGFTVTAVLTLALGVGATTAIFSCVYGLLLKSLPFRDASRIVALSETHLHVQSGIPASYPDYEDWKSQQSSFTEIAADSTINPDTVSLVMDGHSAQVHRVIVSGNFFTLPGISPLIGRTINEQDDTPASDHVAVLSASTWDRYFGRDPGALGRNVALNGTSYTVVGVLPPGAAYPTEGEVWLPLSLLDHDTRVSRIWHSVNVLGRLRPGIELPSAQADIQTVAMRLADAYPATNRNWSVLLKPLREQLVGALRLATLRLLGAVVLVLLIASPNVANLLMIRATSKRRDVAVRQALGADSIRLFSHFLAQTLVICLLGGALGVFLAGSR